MGKQEHKLTYKQAPDHEQTLSVIKSIAYPLGLLAFVFFSIGFLGDYGSRWIGVLVSVMWAAGAIVALIMKAQRKEVINQTMMTITLYLATIDGLWYAIALSSGISSEMMSASFDSNIGLMLSNDLPTFINRLMLITSFMTPFGFIGMQLKRVYQFRHTANLQKTFARKRNIRGLEEKTRTKSF